MTRTTLCCYILHNRVLRGNFTQSFGYLYAKFLLVSVMISEKFPLKIGKDQYIKSHPQTTVNDAYKFS